MVYDVKEFSELLNEFIVLEKKIQSLSMKKQTKKIKHQIDDLKLKFGVKDRYIKVMRNLYEDPDKLQSHFTGCAFITFKTQTMQKEVLKESRKSYFYESLDREDVLHSLNKKKKKKVVNSFTVKKAPEPSDVIWFNFVNNYDGNKWFMLSLLLVFLINVLFIFLFKLLKKAQHKYLDENETINIFEFGISHLFL
jgi:hypothetical protein